jgi:small-conductance mechanosensitive channel
VTGTNCAAGDVLAASLSTHNSSQSPLCSFLARCLMALWMLLCLPALALAQDAGVIAAAQREAKGYLDDLAAIEKELGLSTISAAQLAEHRGMLEDIRTKALVSAERFNAPVADLTQQLAKLGPAPAEGATEAEAIAAQRKLLTEQLDTTRGARTQLELAASRAEQLTARAAALQRDLFFQQIFESNRSVANPGLWFDFGAGIRDYGQRVGALIRNWRNETVQAQPAGLLAIPGILLLAFLIWRLIRNWIVRRVEPSLMAARAPDDIDRLWRVWRGGLAAAAGIVLLGFLIAAVIVQSGYMTPRFGLLIDAIFGIALDTTVVAVVAHRLMAPTQPAWRLVALGDGTAGRLTSLITFVALVFATDDALSELGASLFVPVAYTVGQGALSAILLIALIVLIMLTLQSEQSAEARAANRAYYFEWVKPAAPFVWLLIAIAIVALLLGYVALGNFIARQIFETAAVIALLYLAHCIVDALVRSSFNPASRIGRVLRRVTGLGESAIERIGLLFRTVADILIVLIGLPALFVNWAVTWVDFRALFNSAFFGFRVGDITLSPYSIFLALAILIAGVVVTRLITRWLDGRILSELRVDKGVRDSVWKGATYTGYVLAAGFALTAAGLDFSNVAIVAGALSVGIGFGLQSVVNNFVSGLILLAERPIKVGDWVQVASGEGLVSRIKVRSTEIQTFDNCTIIVPNSSMISEPVKNWTHGDPSGRFGVQVNADYGHDPGEICELLVKLALDHPKVLRYPAPVATLAAFAQTGMSFDLRAHVADIFDGNVVASDIRIAIANAFKERNIAIPIIQAPPPSAKAAMPSARKT